MSQKRRKTASETHDEPLSALVDETHLTPTPDEKLKGGDIIVKMYGAPLDRGGVMWRAVVQGQDSKRVAESKSVVPMWAMLRALTILIRHNHADGMQPLQLKQSDAPVTPAT
jgi:hypothetical protein